MNKKGIRFLVYVIGMFILAIGLTLNTKANLGVSPIISVPYSISQITGYNFGDLTFVVYAIFVVVQIVIHVKLKKNNKIVSDVLQLPLSLVFTRLLNIFFVYIPNFTKFRNSFYSFSFCDNLYRYRSSHVIEYATCAKPR